MEFRSPHYWQKDKRTRMMKQILLFLVCATVMFATATIDIERSAENVEYERMVSKMDAQVEGPQSRYNCVVAISLEVFFFSKSSVTYSNIILFHLATLKGPLKLKLVVIQCQWLSQRVLLETDVIKNVNADAMENAKREEHRRTGLLALIIAAK